MRHHLSKFLLAIGLFVLVAAPASTARAEHGSDSGDSSGSGSSDSSQSSTSGSNDGTASTGSDDSSSSDTSNSGHGSSGNTSGGSGSGDQRQITEKEAAAEIEDTKQDVSKLTASASKHLDQAKLKVCDKREATVNNIMARAVARSQNQITLFDTIATRTEAFYVKQGKTLSNYDTLVAAVTSAKSTAEADLQSMKTNGSFSCNSTDPKGAASLFKDALKKEIKDLKNYKTAVKNLIVGVKSVQSTTEGSNQ